MQSIGAAGNSAPKVAGRRGFGGLRAIEALVEATNLVAAAGDLDNTLDALAVQARVLLAADDVAINLRIPGTTTVIRRRLSTLAAATSGFATANTQAQPNPCTSEAQETGRPVFVADIHADPRIPSSVRAAFPTVRSVMYVPLNAGDQRLGMLIARWVRRRKPRESVRRLAEAFARNAAVAVRGARLLDEARSVRAEADTMRRELETILDVAEESVVVFDREGRLIRANRRAVERITHLLGRFPDSFQDLAHQAGASQVGEGQLARLVGNVQRGQASSELLPVVGADGQVRQIQVHLAPARNAAGDVTAIVLLARDISELHDAIVERGRLDGAVKTARRAAHELNNSLSPLVGYGEMLARSLTGEDADLAGRMYQSALRAADLLNQLQRVIRFQQTEFGGQTMLDLDAATSPPAEPAHPT